MPDLRGGGPFPALRPRAAMPGPGVPSFFQAVPQKRGVVLAKQLDLAQCPWKQAASNHSREGFVRVLIRK